MGTAENKQLIQNLFAELEKGNAEAFLGYLADNVRFTLIGTTKFSGVCNGKKEFIDKVLAPLSAELEGGLAITPENLIAEGDFIAMQAKGKAITKTGNFYDNTYCMVFRIANGKVQEMTEYNDTELITQAFEK
jgi:ketosteroid isomerase-like protein